MARKEKNKKEVKGFSSFLNNQIDFTLLITILLLLSIGLIMVLSASVPSSLQKYGNSYKFFEKQLIFAVAGVIAMWFISKIDYRIYQRFYWLAYGVSILLLVAVLAFGSESHGAKRWIEITKSLSFQPSEIVKFLMIIFYAGILVRNRETLGKYFKGLVFHVALLAPVILLLLLEPHVSTSMVIIIT